MHIGKISMTIVMFSDHTKNWMRLVSNGVITFCGHQLLVLSGQFTLVKANYDGVNCYRGP